MVNKYDYLIVGAGLYGSVCAFELNKKGKKCLVIDKRSHIGGNVYTEEIEGINVHKYGAHIFHTANEIVWNYVNEFCEFNRYTNSPLASYKGALYNLPFNMNTFYKLWGVTSPEEAKNIIQQQRKKYSHIKQPRNLEEQALILGGEDIYKKLIKGYTEKQWGRSAKDLPAFIIKRIPFRYTFDNNYFSDNFQGIPIGGYGKMIAKMLSGVETRTNIDYYDDKHILDLIADKVIYTGKIDQYFDYRFGKLEYRSLHFEHQLLNLRNYQGNAVVNYTDIDVPYTRIIEHKHFEFGTQECTYISHEYPDEYSVDKEPYYPINDDFNQKIYKKYEAHAKSFKSVVFGGRLAEYKYYNMDQIVENALAQIEKELS